MKPALFAPQLLWKDCRQALPSIVGCWALLALIELLFFMRQMSADGSSMSIFEGVYVLALAAPTLAALASSGMLIGHERQSRTWNWSSSLPISWRSALLSKAVVWLASSGLMALTLWLLFIGLAAICMASGYQYTAAQEHIDPSQIVITLVMVPLECFICFSIACLLLTETLHALVLAAVAVAALHLFFVDFLPHVVFDVPWNVALTWRGPGGFGLVIGFVFLILVPALVLMALFRWRWMLGQTRELGMPHFSQPARSFPTVEPAWLVYGVNRKSPQELPMLFRHAWLASWGLRLVIFLATAAAVFRFHAGIELFLPVGLAAGLLGLSAFGGDQSLNRYRFLSDRGVHWARLMVAHTSVPLLFLLALIGLALLRLGYDGRFSSPDLSIAIVCIIGAFVIGLFCSLCTPSVVTALAVSFGTFMLALFCFTMVQSLWRLFSPQPAGLEVVLLFSVTGLLVASMWLVRRWLIVDRVAGAKVYLSTLVAVLFLPLLVHVSLAYLTVPYYPWQGVAADQVKYKSEFGMPETSLPAALLRRHAITDASDQATIGADLYTGIAGAGATIVADDSPLLQTQKPLPGQSTETASQPIDREMAKLALQRFVEDLRQPGVGIGNRRFVHEQSITETLALAVIETQRRDAELAVLAWQANRRLLELVDYSALESFWLMDERIAVAKQWRSLTDADWQFLSQAGDLERMLPAPVPTTTLTNLIKMQYTAQREQLLSRSALSSFEAPLLNVSSPRRAFWPRQLFNLYPPLRWLAERNLSYDLTQEIASVEAAGQVRGPLPIYSQLASVPNPLHTLTVLEQQNQRRAADVNARRETRPTRDEASLK